MVKQMCRECCRDISEEEYNRNNGYCNNCYEEREEIEKEKRKFNGEKIDDDIATNEDMQDEIYNVKAIVGIIGIVGFICSLVMLFISMELIGLFILGLILTPIIMAIASSYLKKKNKETYFYRYKKFIKQSGMSNCEDISFKNIVGMDIDTKNKLLSTYSYYEGQSNILKFDEIIDFEIFENGNSVVSSRSGSAVVGGLLFGGLGAVAGASGSRTINDNCSTLKLNIYTNKTQNTVITLDFLEGSIPKSSMIYEDLKDIVNKMIGFLKIAREDNRQKERQEDKKVIIENTEEIKHESNLSSLKELAELKNQGIVTEEEFEKAKKRILEKI